MADNEPQTLNPTFINVMSQCCFRAHLLAANPGSASALHTLYYNNTLYCMTQHTPLTNALVDQRKHTILCFQSSVCKLCRSISSRVEEVLPRLVDLLLFCQAGTHFSLTFTGTLSTRITAQPSTYQHRWCSRLGSRGEFAR